MGWKQTAETHAKVTHQSAYEKNASVARVATTAARSAGRGDDVHIIELQPRDAQTCKGGRLKYAYALQLHIVAEVMLGGHPEESWQWHPDEPILPW